MNCIKNASIDAVEIGFRFLDKVKTKGPFAYSEESFLRSLKIWQRKAKYQLEI